MEKGEALFSDAEWFPYRADLAKGEMQFAHLTRDHHRRATFLTDEYIERGERRTMPLRDVVPAAKRVPPSRLHFIFHSAFCCSTLLARALDLPGKVMSLKEPAALMNIADAALAAGDRNRFNTLIEATLALMARPLSGDEAMVIKPTNVVNPIIDPMLRARPQAKALLIYCPLPVFLRSVAQKGLWGRVWVRRVNASLSRLPEFNPGYSEAERWEHSDLQVAALTWLQQHAQFNRTLRSQPHGRIATLDSETLLKNPEQTLNAVNRHFDLDIAPDDLAAIAAGPIFASNSKNHKETFDTARRAEGHARAEAAYGEEIRMVVGWAEAVAAHVRMPMRLGHGLLA